jgi:hypothetical protein
LYYPKLFKNVNALSPQLHHFSSVYVITKMQENQVELKWNGTHQLLAYADDVNLLGDNIDTIKKNTETLTNASKEVGLEITQSRHQKVGQYRYTKRAKRSFENVPHSNF